MSRTSPTSTTEQLPDLSKTRRDMILAGVFTAAGLAAIIIARGGVGTMIAGSVGSLGGGCLAVGLVLLEPRLSYIQRASASLPIVLLLATVGFAIKDNAFALAGYPLLLLGIAGLLPAVARSMKSNPGQTAADGKSSDMHSTNEPALSN